jgi:hypothetical protein
MQTMAFAVPVLPGQLPRLKELAHTLRTDRRAEFQDFLQRVHTREENWYLQPFGEQQLCICYLAADDLGAAFAALAQSQHPFDVFIKSANKDIFGLDFNDSNSGAMPEVLFEFKPA